MSLSTTTYATTKTCNCGAVSRCFGPRPGVCLLPCDVCLDSSATHTIKIVASGSVTSAEPPGVEPK